MVWREVTVLDNSRQEHLRNGEVSMLSILSPIGLDVYALFNTLFRASFLCLSVPPMNYYSKHLYKQIIPFAHMIEALDRELESIQSSPQENRGYLELS